MHTHISWQQKAHRTAPLQQTSSKHCWLPPSCKTNVNVVLVSLFFFFVKWNVELSPSLLLVEAKHTLQGWCRVPHSVGGSAEQENKQKPA